WIRRGRGVVVVRRPADRLKRPPAAEVVLVVPGVDRCVGRCQVLHREETCAVSSVEMVSCDELAGDVVPARDGVALPPLGDIRLGWCSGRGGPTRERETVAAKPFDLVDVRR